VSDEEINGRFNTVETLLRLALENMGMLGLLIIKQREEREKEKRESE